MLFIKINIQFIKVKKTCFDIRISNTSVWILYSTYSVSNEQICYVIRHIPDSLVDSATCIILTHPLNSYSTNGVLYSPLFLGRNSQYFSFLLGSWKFLKQQLISGIWNLWGKTFCGNNFPSWQVQKLQI